jgi:hypothetical protein
MHVALRRGCLVLVGLVASCSAPDGDSSSTLGSGEPCLGGGLCHVGYECVSGFCIPTGDETDGGDGDPGDGDTGDGDPGDGDPGDGDPGDGDGDTGDGDGDTGDGDPGDGDPGDGDPGDGDPGDGDPGDGDPGDGDGDTGDGDGDTGDGDGDSCVPDAQCVDKRVGLVFIVHYSSHMNTLWDNNLSRWEWLDASLDALPANTVARLQNDAIISLIRYGHDPSLNPGTMVVGDDSGIIDGQAHDVMWADCNWMDVLDACDAAGPPMNGNLVGMGSWLKGAMDLALADIQAAKLLQQNAGREYRVILVYQGHWSSQNGNQTYEPPEQNPALTITTLNQTHDVPTYVVTMDPDDPSKVAAANEFAAAGGTGVPFMAYMGNELAGELTDAIEAALGNTSCD